MIAKYKVFGIVRLCIYLWIDLMTDIVQSLANKYRPKNFDELIGQDHIVNILKAKSQNHSLGSQNYVFFGPRWTGKTSTARLFAKAINATNFDAQGNPDPADPVIEAVDKGTTLDYVEIDAASHTGVDNIREEILAKVPYPPTVFKKKVYVIDEVHMLSKWAFNALLKTIEEPRPYVSFILATTEINKVPETIISRCQVFNFKKVADDIIIKHLEEIATKEGIEREAEALDMIAQMSEWCVRDSVKYLDQVSILGKVTAAHVSSFLGVASNYTIKQFLDTTLSGDEKAVFDAIDTLHNQGVDLYNFAKQLIVYIDTRLYENMDGYMRVIEMLSYVMSTIRYYPYASVVYKMAYHKFFVSWGSSTPAPVVTNIAQATQEVSTPAAKTEVSAVTQTPQTNTADTPIEQTQDNSDFVWDMDLIREKLIASIDKEGIKQNLQDHIILEYIGYQTIRIITTGKMAHMLLSKSEHIQYIEHLLNTICGQQVKIEVVFEHKEDYLARTLM